VACGVGNDIASVAATHCNGRSTDRDPWVLGWPLDASYADSRNYAPFAFDL
jgi:hypothetical protein